MRRPAPLSPWIQAPLAAETIGKVLPSNDEEIRGLSRGSVTIEDVAQAAGVSRQTVSRVINQAANVAAATRERVEGAIDELGYAPNLAARRMGGTRSYLLLALIAHSPASLSEQTHLPLGELLMRGIETCGAANYHLMFEQVDTSNPEGLQRRLSATLSALQPDGVIVLPPLDEAKVVHDLLKREKVAARCLGERAEFGRIVPGLDEASFAEKAAKHLVDLGHRQVGFVTSSGNHQRSQRRLEGYRRTLAKVGSRAQRHFVAAAPADYPQVVELAKSWLTPTIRPTAIITECAADALAFHQVAAELGIAIPRELSLLSLADSAVLTRPKPAISACDMPYEALFAQACKTLISGEETVRPDEEIGQFTERASIAKAPRAV